jgi:hypothetical protein
MRVRLRPKFEPISQNDKNDRADASAAGVIAAWVIGAVRRPLAFCNRVPELHQ